MPQNDTTPKKSAAHFMSASHSSRKHSTQRERERERDIDLLHIHTHTHTRRIEQAKLCFALVGRLGLVELGCQDTSCDMCLVKK